MIVAFRNTVRDSYDGLNARTTKFAVRVILFARAIDEIPVITLSPFHAFKF